MDESEKLPRSVTIYLTDKEADGLDQFEVDHGLDEGELAENFLRDLLAWYGLADHGNGSDEEEAAARYFERCANLSRRTP